MDQVIALYPSAPADWRNRWAAMVENPQAVRELNASITSVDDFQMNGDAATVRFTLHLEFRDYRNAEQELNAPYTGTLRRSGDIWVIAELR
jgi:glycine betaine/choline ABC-type transport system substrate-binding protein